MYIQKKASAAAGPSFSASGASSGAGFLAGSSSGAAPSFSHARGRGAAAPPLRGTSDTPAQRVSKVLCLPFSQFVHNVFLERFFWNMCPNIFSIMFLEHVFGICFFRTLFRTFLLELV